MAKYRYQSETNLIKEYDIGRLDIDSVATRLLLYQFTIWRCEGRISTVSTANASNDYQDEEIDSLRDLDDFAAQISALDLVISTSNTTVIWLEPWVKKFGPCCPIYQIGAGCWTEKIHHGIQV